MNFVVPQNLDIEDTLFWGLSVRQIVYLGGASGAAIAAFLYLPSTFAFILVAPIACLAALLSFYKHNNKPISFLLQSMFSYSIKNKLYIWKQGASKSSDIKIKIKNPTGITIPAETHNRNLKSTSLI